MLLNIELQIIKELQGFFEIWRNNILCSPTSTQEAVLAQKDVTQHSGDLFPGTEAVHLDLSVTCFKVESLT